MPTEIFQEGQIESFCVDEDFKTVITNIEHAGSKGMTLMLLDGMNGNREAINIGKILRIRELDD